MTGFKMILNALPRDLKVLDVGAGGLHGVNTTDFLISYFGVGNVLGVCNAKKEVATYQAQRAEKKLPPIEIITEDFYKLKFEDKFDLLVLDLNIENNLKDWSEEGLARNWKLLKKDGILITYIMLTEHYGDPDVTPALIRKHAEEFWNGTLDHQTILQRIWRLENYKLFTFSREKRRPYILWIALQKKNGK